MHGGDITLREVKVMFIGSKDMRDEEAVPDNGNRTLYRALQSCRQVGFCALDVLPEAVKGVEEFAGRWDADGAGFPPPAH